MSHQPMEDGVRNFWFPRVQVQMAELLLVHPPPKCTAWQDNFECPADRTGRSLQFKKPFYGLLRALCWVPRMATVLGVREISNCTSPKLDLGPKTSQPPSLPSRLPFSFCQDPQSFYEEVMDSPFFGNPGPRAIEIPPKV